jgi:hypothetical protein
MIKSVHHKYGEMIDPLSGWKYGFPKHLPEDKDYKELLRESGYPEKDIEFAMRHSRIWFTHVGFSLVKDDKNE